MVPMGKHEAGAFRRLLPRWAWQPLRSLGVAFLAPLVFSWRTGHFRSSFAGKACDGDGKPLPWYSFPAIDFLSQRSFVGKRVLEFGGGQSTLYWSARADFILTIEDDEAWSKFLKKQMGENVAVHHVPIDRATRSVEPIRQIIENSCIERFDLILIDGHLREELVDLAIDFLAPRGAILMDNAEGYRFQELLKSRNFRRIDFYGFSSNNWRRSCTSVAFIDDCFLLDNEAPIVSLP